MPSGSSIHISISPQGSIAGARTTGTPAAASRAYSPRTSRTWIQIITERPAGPAAGCGDCATVWLGGVTSPGVGWLSRYQTGFPASSHSRSSPGTVTGGDLW